MLFNSYVFIFVFLPVTLAAWGPALDSKRVRRGSTTFSPMWERWGGLVVRRRWIAGIAGLGFISVLATFYFVNLWIVGLHSYAR